MNQWQWLIDECRANGWRFLPCDGAEPYFSYEVVASVLQMERSYIEKLVSKHKIEKHPVFSGLVRFSSFALLDGKQKGKP
jgi:hypothetical protein